MGAKASKTALLTLGIYLALTVPARAAYVETFTKDHGQDVYLNGAFPETSDYDLTWNFRNLPGWDRVLEITGVTFELRLRDDCRCGIPDPVEKFRYVFLTSIPNYRIFGVVDPVTLPDSAGNTSYFYPSLAFPADGDGEFPLIDLLDGRFQTRLRVTNNKGDLEFRYASVTIEALVSPEPATFGFSAAALVLGALALKARRPAR